VQVLEFLSTKIPGVTEKGLWTFMVYHNTISGFVVTHPYEDQTHLTSEPFPSSNPLLKTVTQTSKCSICPIWMLNLLLWTLTFKSTPKNTEISINQLNAIITTRILYQFIRRPFNHLIIFFPWRRPRIMRTQS